MSSEDVSAHELKNTEVEDNATQGSTSLKDTLGKLWIRLHDSVSRRWIDLRFYLCMLLHALLVVAHIALVVFAFRKHHPKERSNMFLTLAYYTITYVPSYVFKAYGPLLTWITQDLALKRNFKTEQSLSALHDKSAAWLGTGAAVTAILNQTKVRTSAGGIMLILLWFLCLWGLEYTTEKLIDVAYSEATGTVWQRLAANVKRATLDDLLEAFPVVSTLPQQKGAGFFTIGVYDRFVYSIPNLGGVNPLTSNAVEFDVTCQMIPDGLQQSGDVNINVTTTGVDVAYPFHINDELEDLQLFLAPDTLNIVSAQYRNGSGSPPTFFVAATYVQILNDDNDPHTAQSSAGLNPPVALSSCDQAGSASCTPQSSVQIIACDVSASDQRIVLDQDSGSVLTERLPDDDLITSWTNWTLRSSGVPPFLQPVGQLPSLSPSSDVLRNVTIQDGDNVTTAIRRFTLLEDNVMYFLGFYNSNYDHSGIALSDLESVLEQAIALIYWRASFQIGTNNTREPPQTDEWALEITIYEDWIFSGFGLSILLFILAFVLTRQPSPLRNATMNRPSKVDFIDKAGVLQLAWLMAPDESALRSEVQKGLGGVVDPITKVLREEGKNVRVKMSDFLPNRKATGVEASSSDSARRTQTSEIESLPYTNQA